MTESRQCPLCWHPYTDTRDCACGCNGRSCIDCDAPLDQTGPQCSGCEQRDTIPTPPLDQLDAELHIANMAAHLELGGRLPS